MVVVPFWYSITSRRLPHPEEFMADMAALFELLRNGAIHPVVIDREPLAAAKNVHARIDAGGFGGKTPTAALAPIAGNLVTIDRFERAFGKLPQSILR